MNTSLGHVPPRKTLTPPADIRQPLERVDQEDKSLQKMARFTLRERVMLAVLKDIVIEVMECPPTPPDDSESYLPSYLIERAQRALEIYGMRVPGGKEESSEGEPA